MRTFGLFLSMAMLATPFECDAGTLTRLSAHTSIEAITSLDISQLWNSTEPQLTEGRNVTVQFRMFDVEARPRQGGLYGCGWILIGTSDVGIQPVGVRIWSDARCDLLVTSTKDAGSSTDDRFALSVRSSEVFEIRVGADSIVSIAATTKDQ
jgi:hypothetical protein